MYKVSLILVGLFSVFSPNLVLGEAVSPSSVTVCGLASRSVNADGYGGGYWLTVKVSTELITVDNIDGDTKGFFEEVMKKGPSAKTRVCLRGSTIPLVGFPWAADTIFEWKSGQAR